MLKKRNVLYFKICINKILLEIYFKLSSVINHAFKKHCLMYKSQHNLILRCLTFGILQVCVHFISLLLFLVCQFSEKFFTLKKFSIMFSFIVLFLSFAHYTIGQSVNFTDCGKCCKYIYKLTINLQ
jgi:hypothetical protein